MRESYIEKKVVDYAISKGWLVYKFVSPNNKGIPDRIFMKSGVAFFMEFKKPGGKPTTLQTVTMEKLIAEGFDCWVVDDVNKGIGIIDNYEN